MRLHVNIDHVATLRNARGGANPSPIKAAKICEAAGAAGIVFHLRGDRRHITDDDAHKLKEVTKGLLNFEMAATEEMLEIAQKVNPSICTLVPETQEELTTEGGLNMAKVFEDFKNRVFPILRATSIKISLFIDPNPEDIEMAANLGADIIELHTGTYASTTQDEIKAKELDRLAKAAKLAHKKGLKVTAGHGLSLDNLPLFMDKVPHVTDVSIGHALISTSVFEGLENTVKAYVNCISDYKLN